MLEIPQRIFELFHRLLHDFDYFTYAMLNGGLVGVLGIYFLFYMIRGLKHSQ